MCHKCTRPVEAGYWWATLVLAYKCSFRHVTESVTGGNSVERFLFEKIIIGSGSFPRSVYWYGHRSPDICWCCRERTDHNAVTLFLCFSEWRAW